MRYVIDSDLSRSEIRDLLKEAGDRDARILEERKDCGVWAYISDDLSKSDEAMLRHAGIDPVKVLYSASHGVEVEEALEDAIGQALDETENGEDRWLLGSPWDGFGI